MPRSQNEQIRTKKKFCQNGCRIIARCRSFKVTKILLADANFILNLCNRSEIYRNLFEQIILLKEGLWDRLKCVSEASVELVAILRKSRRGQKFIPYFNGTKTKILDNSRQTKGMCTKKVHRLIYADTIQITFLPQHPQTQTFSIIINFSIH